VNPTYAVVLLLSSIKMGLIKKISADILPGDLSGKRIRCSYRREEVGENAQDI
jgi:hypothetical protein